MRHSSTNNYLTSDHIQVSLITTLENVNSAEAIGISIEIRDFMLHFFSREDRPSGRPISTQCESENIPVGILAHSPRPSPYQT